MDYKVKEIENGKYSCYQYTFKPNKELEFNIPFVMYVPKGEVNSNMGVFFATPKPADNDDRLEAIFKDLEDNTFYPKPYYEANMPCIVPIIPRFDYYPMTYLTKDVYENKVDLIPDSITLEQKEGLKNIDEQVCSIIEAGKSFMEQLGYETSEKATLFGYSAASKFASSFTYLHPDMVQALIAGGTTGLQIRPVKEIGGEKLNFPLGINDVPDNKEEFSKIPQFYYLGKDDESDPAMCKCELDTEKDANNNPKPKKDIDGNINPYLKDGKYQAFYTNMYSDDEVNTIYTKFGVSPQERFINAEKIFQENGINATFKMYEGNHKTVNQNLELEQDVNNFINENVLEKGKVK